MDLVELNAALIEISALEATADVLEISPTTVKREWTVAKAGLRCALTPE